MEVAELAAHIKSLSDLDKVVILNKVGRPVVRIGWSVGLFFEQGQTLEKRLLANNVLRDFLAVFQGRITHYHPVDAERLKKVGDLDVAAYSDADAEAAVKKSGRNANDRYSAEVYGFDDGTEVMEPARYYLGIGACSKERSAPSDIVVNLPISWPPDGDLTAVVDLFVRWCTIIRPAHGTVSPALILMQGGGSNDLVTSYPMLQRFPGLDYLDASNWISSARKHPRKNPHDRLAGGDRRRVRPGAGRHRAAPGRAILRRDPRARVRRRRGDPGRPEAALRRSQPRRHPCGLSGRRRGAQAARPRPRAHRDVPPRPRAARPRAGDEQMAAPLRMNGRHDYGGDAAGAGRPRAGEGEAR